MALLDDLIERIRGLSPEQRQALEREAEQHPKWGKDAIWVPNPGPQTDAYYSKADVLLFGGAGGGGKSELGIGLAFMEHNRSLILRRRYSDIGALIERAIEINGTRSGYNGTPPPILRTRNDKFIQFGANQHPGDEQTFQGRPYDFKCVSGDTRVVMADGTLRPIVSVGVGDVVSTLDGPRVVTRTFKKTGAAVRIVARVSEDVAVSQIQGESHSVLTTSGWLPWKSASTSRHIPDMFFESSIPEFEARSMPRSSLGVDRTLPQVFLLFDHLIGRSPSLSSFASTACRDRRISCESIRERVRSCERQNSYKFCRQPRIEVLSSHLHQLRLHTFFSTLSLPELFRRAFFLLSSLTSLSTVSRICRIFSKLLPLPYATPLPPERCQFSDRQQPRLFCQDTGAHQYWSGISSSGQREGARSCFSMSGGGTQEIQQLLLSSFRSMPLLPDRQSTPSHSSSPLFSHAAAYVPSTASLRGSLDRCLSCSHQGGEQRQLRAQDFCQSCPRQQDDVEQQIPIRLQDGVLEDIRKRTFQIGSYPHPYKSEIRSTNQLAILSSIEYHDVGVTDLYDLTVDGSNHYITEGGFVNKNCFDEACHFLRSQIDFHLGWLRSGDPKQRCRAVLASNPPTDSDGDWLIGMFRPWLDETHHNPAKPAELRWFVTVDDNTDHEVPEEDIFLDENGRSCCYIVDRVVMAHSRTFIPAKLSDNPYLARTNYQSRLDALPEPLRSAIRDGNFLLSRKDAEFQVIPTQWIIEAQGRWNPEGWRKKMMSAIGYDPAGGGSDAAEMVWRYDNWFAEPVTKRGEDTSDGSTSAATITRYRRDGAEVIVDVGGGYGGPVVMRLGDNQIDATAFQPAAVSNKRTHDRQLKFGNLRAEAWWRMREALDPDQEGGSPVALPPSPELRSDLAAPTYKVTHRGIIIESKDDLRKRLGRSTGKGDACVMCNLARKGAIGRQGRSTASDPRAAGLPKYARRREGPLTRKR